MKKIVLMAALMLSALAAHAQVSWTVRAGANVSGIENSDSQMKLGWKVGAGVDYSFNDWFSVRPMLYYSTKGCGRAKSASGFSADRDLKLGYLELPVLASFHFGLGRNTSLAANVGPYFGYRVSKSPSQIALKYQKFDAGANVGLDFINHGFVIGVEAEYGFSRLAKTPGGNLRNINYSLVVGYNF